LQQHPDLIGFYANNDDMALGVVEAVRAAGLSKQVSVFGTDGISDAYASILRGELTGTDDSFPELTGEVAMDVAVRLIGGQALPRVVSTPQAIITKDNAQEFKSADRDQLKKLLLQN
jgi:ribose transport system substrate-binding protein